MQPHRCQGLKRGLENQPLASRVTWCLTDSASSSGGTLGPAQATLPRGPAANGAGERVSLHGEAPSAREISHAHSIPALIHQPTVILGKTVDLLFRKRKRSLVIPLPFPVSVKALVSGKRRQPCWHYNRPVYSTSVRIAPLISAALRKKHLSPSSLLFPLPHRHTSFGQLSCTLV